MNDSIKYNVVIVKGNETKLLTVKNKLAWCNRTAKKHCNDILQLKTAIKDFDDVYISQADV